MWVSAEQVVKETESASIKGSSKIIPGLLYRFTSVFFDLWITQHVWKIMNGRK
jgi:short-subunit dehydrogenase